MELEEEVRILERKLKQEEEKRKAVYTELSVEYTADGKPKEGTNVSKGALL